MALIALLLGFLAALANAGSNVLQRAANRSESSDLEFSLRLIGELVRKPIWLAGIGAMMLSVVLQAAGLGFGTLVSVERLLVLELPLSLVGAALWLGGTLGRREWLAVIGMTAGTIGLIAFLGPRSCRSRSRLTAALGGAGHSTKLPLSTRSSSAAGLVNRFWFVAIPGFEAVAAAPPLLAPRSGSPRGRPLVRGRRSHTSALKVEEPLLLLARDQGTDQLQPATCPGHCTLVSRRRDVACSCFIEGLKGFGREQPVVAGTANE